MYKEFLIIGVLDKDTLELAEQSTEESKTDKDATLSFNVNPSLFYSHIKQGEEAEECERRRVIKDFCFPNGV